MMSGTSLMIYIYLLPCKVYNIQCNGKTNDEFRYRWNNYKDNNRRCLMVEDHKQATDKQLSTVVLLMKIK